MLHPTDSLNSNFLSILVFFREGWGVGGGGSKTLALGCVCSSKMKKTWLALDPLGTFKCQ